MSIEPIYNKHGQKLGRSDTITIWCHAFCSAAQKIGMTDFTATDIADLVGVQRCTIDKAIHSGKKKLKNRISRGWIDD